jgi:hypothetical protein
MNTKRKLIVMAIAGAVCLYGLNAWAGAADSPNSGEPPKGVAYQSDAKGTKLTGVISIELTQVDTTEFTATAARGTMRLRQGNELHTFFAEVDDTHDCSDLDMPDENDCVRWEFEFEIEQIEEALLAEFTAGPNGILAKFFGAECGPNGDTCSLVVTPKLIDESAEIFAVTGGGLSLFLVADVVLAVK